MSEPMHKDREFREATVERVEADDSGGWTVTHGGGWVIGVPSVPGLPAPRVGEAIRTYGRGLGFSVRGITIGGRVYRYQTATEHKAENARLAAEREQQKEVEFVKNLEDTDRRIAALPPIFRTRIEKFQQDGGHEFRRDFEGYELFCCEQAVLIAEAMPARDGVAAFAKLSWEQQKRAVPGLDGGHSGNTFGMACRLAHFYLNSPDFIVKEHGALTPLVGCDAYGCKHD